MTTKIEWSEMVWNPVVGCTKVSQGCKHCYAKDLHDKRHKAYLAGKAMPQQYAEPFERVQLMPERLEVPLHWKKPRTVFVNSVSDLFHEDVPFEFIDKVFAVMALTPQHTYQVLTKRPERMRDYMTTPERAEEIGYRAYDVWEESGLAANGDVASALIRGGAACALQEASSPWPLLNVWMGVSVEDQAAADQRIPVLLETPAAVRFLSCEPLLGPVALGTPNNWLDAFGGIDWVIVGGESGSGARPCNVAWIRSIVEQCKAAGTACFVKQLGTGYVHDSEYPRGNGLPEFSMSAYSKRKNRKGGDPADWPSDIRVREMPR